MGLKRRSFAAASMGLALPGLARSSSRAQGMPAAISPAYFGMHIHRLLPDSSLRPTTSWPASMIGSLRLWDSSTRWADIAPRRDRWNFDRLDGYVALAEAHGCPVLYTLGSTPRWASARPDEPGPYGPGCAAEPLALADWDEYVCRVVTRYRGRIAAYEVWNEPYFSEFAADRGQPTFFSGSARQMVDMARIARVTIRALDPAALLATPGFVNGAHRLDRFLAAGGGPLVDVVAYHFYASDGAQISSQAEEVRAVLARHRLSHLPIWNTECGVEGQPEASNKVPGDPEVVALLAGAEVAQFLILGAANGIERFYYYAWDNGLTGMVDRDGATNARAPAFEQARRWILGSRVGVPVPIGDGAFQVSTEQGGKRYVLAWSDTPATVTLDLPIGTRIAEIEPLLVGRAVPRAAPRSARVDLTPAPIRLRLDGASAPSPTRQP